MNFNLEQLWYAYLNLYPYENDEEIIRLRDDLLLKEQQLRSGFTEEQTKLFLGQYRTILMVQMRRQIFRQSKQKFARIVDPLRRIFVTNDGKDASRCAIKATAANCAVLP